MALDIEVYKDYITIGTQRIDRPKGTPAGDWISHWTATKRCYDDTAWPKMK